MSYGPLTSEGTVVQDCNDTADWTVGAGSIALDEDHYVTGDASIKVTSREGNTGYATATIDLDMSAWENVRFWVYLHDDLTKYNSVQVSFSSTTDISKRFAISPSPANLGDAAEGWVLWAMAPDEWVNVNSESWANTMLRVRIVVTPVAGEVASASFDYIHGDVRGQASCIIACDGPHVNFVELAVPEMDSRGLRGVCYVGPDLIGTSVFGDADDVHQLFRRGWDLGSYISEDLTTYTQSQVTAMATDCMADVLTAAGSPTAPGRQHFAYSESAHDGTAMAGLQDAGALSGRATSGSTCRIGIEWPMVNPFLISDVGIGGSTALATVETFIDNAILKASTIILLFHGMAVADPTEYDWYLDRFQDLLDYIIAKGSDMPVVTLTEWFDAGWRNLDVTTYPMRSAWRARKVTK